MYESGYGAKNNLIASKEVIEKAWTRSQVYKKKSKTDLGWGGRVHLFCAGYMIAWASPILSQTSSDVVKRGLGSTLQKSFMWPLYRTVPTRKGRIKTVDKEVDQKELNKEKWKI